MNKNQLLHAWLDRVCRMIQGARNAVYLEDCDDDGPAVYWRDDTGDRELLIASARRACHEDRILVDQLDHPASVPDTSSFIIAKPIKTEGENTAAVSIVVRMDPARQAVVIQLLDWGESWLRLVTESAIGPDPHHDRANDDLADSTRKAILRVSPKILVFLALVLVIAIMGSFSGTYRVSAPALLEGRIERVVVAPFEGYIASGMKKAGDIVRKDDVLAEMDAAPLRLSRQQFESEKDEYDRQYRQALGRRDMAEAYIRKAQVTQAEAQLNMIQRKIEQSLVRSPIAGVLISGDLSRSQGSPVKLGEVLFEVAPLDDYRLVIHVDERDVADIQPGARGLVTLRSLPQREFPFRVDRISPVFEERLDSVAYRVEARLDEAREELRPGMQGTAKVEAGRRSYLWIYFHDIFDAVRLWLWKWMP